MSHFQKLANQRKVLEKYAPSKWSSQRRQKVEQILEQGLEYVSSEELGDECDPIHAPTSMVEI